MALSCPLSVNDDGNHCMSGSRFHSWDCKIGIKVLIHVIMKHREFCFSKNNINRICRYNIIIISHDR